MKQGVLKQKRVKLLLSPDSSCYRARKKGERKRRSVRGCIVGPDLSIVNLTIVKMGDKEIEGLTDDASIRPLRLGPKRASRIRKFLVRNIVGMKTIRLTGWNDFLILVALVHFFILTYVQELERGDDVRKAVNMIRRKTTYTNKKGKEIKIDKAPKIQRLVTPLTLQRKRRRAQRKSDARAKALSEAAAFQQLSTQRLKERRASEKARRSSRKRSRISKA